MRGSSAKYSPSPYRWNLRNVGSRPSAQIASTFAAAVPWKTSRIALLACTKASTKASNIRPPSKATGLSTNWCRTRPAARTSHHAASRRFVRRVARRRRCRELRAPGHLLRAPPPPPPPLLLLLLLPLLLLLLPLLLLPPLGKSGMYGL